MNGRRFISTLVVLGLCAAQLTAQQAVKAEGEFAVLIDGLGAGPYLVWPRACVPKENHPKLGKLKKVFNVRGRMLT